MAEGRPAKARRQGRPGRGTCMARDTFANQPTQESVMETYDPKKSATEVRQGNPRKMNLRVLITSLSAVVILFVVIYLIYSLTQSNPS
jgi:hypothetical protein